MGAHRGTHARMRCRVSTPPEMSVRVLQVIAGLDPRAGGPPVSASQMALSLKAQGLNNELAFVFDVMDPNVLLNVSFWAGGSVVHGFPMGRGVGRAGPRWGYSPRLAWWLGRRFGD